MNIVNITKKAENSVLGGHPWIYDQEVITDLDLNDGEVVCVKSTKNKFLGYGYFNSNSKIRIRLISTNANDKVFDYNFFKRRCLYAYQFRKTILNQKEIKACRLIFGESDGLSGLTVDRFEDVLVIQVLSLAMEVNKQLIYKALVEVLKDDGQKITTIYERNDNPIREKEGLTSYKDYYKGYKTDKTKVTIVENDVIYDVDFVNGQKTGYFLDQRNNRALTAVLAKSKKVLDVCTHNGSFGLNCAINGALSTTFVDISKHALDSARHNATLNEISGSTEFIQANMFEYLETLKNTKPYDLIIVDPPAFTKSRTTKDNAINGYVKLNMLAMKALKRGSYLATCSCSHFVSEMDFKKALERAAKLAGREIKQISYTQQAKDHPIMWNVSETKYLKFYLLQVL